jgi:hypothetical protein
LSIPFNALEEWIQDRFECVLTARREVDELIALAF